VDSNKQADQHCRSFFLTVVFIVLFSLSLSFLIIPCVKRRLFLSSGGRIKKEGLILRWALWALWQSESQCLDLESRLGLFSDGAYDVRSWSNVVIIYRVFILRMTVTLQYLTLLKLTFV